MAIDVFNKATIRRMIQSRGDFPFYRSEYLSLLSDYWFDMYGAYVVNQLFVGRITRLRHRMADRRVYWVKGPQ